MIPLPRPTWLDAPPAVIVPGRRRRRRLPRRWEPYTGHHRVCCCPKICPASVLLTLFGVTANVDEVSCYVTPTGGLLHGSWTRHDPTHDGYPDANHLTIYNPSTLTTTPGSVGPNCSYLSSTSDWWNMGIRLCQFDACDWDTWGLGVLAGNAEVELHWDGTSRAWKVTSVILTDDVFAADYGDNFGYPAGPSFSDHVFEWTGTADLGDRLANQAAAPPNPWAVAVDEVEITLP